MHPTKKKLKATSLDLDQLKGATGGKGTYCGHTIHCECGADFAPLMEVAVGGSASCGGGGTTMVDVSAACPYCGRSTDL